jgi:hypothetical protein
LEPEPVVAAHSSEPQPETKAEPQPEAPVIAKPVLLAKVPQLAVEPAAAPPAPQEPAAAATAGEEAVKEIAEPKLEEKPPVILFKPKDSGRKWRIPFVSSFLLMAAAIAWLQFM